MNPSQARAYRSLKASILAGEGIHKGRLPTVKELAKQACVSLASASTALKQMEKEGLLVIRKRGIWLAQGEADSAIPNAHDQGGGQSSGIAPATSKARGGPKWKKLAERLEQEILRGHYAPGKEMPATTELAENYGVSFPTMRKATEAILAMGLVRENKARLEVSIARQETQRSTLLFLGLGEENGDILWISDRMREFTGELIAAGKRAGLRIEIIGIPPQWRSERLKVRFEKLGESQAILGCVIWPLGLPEARLSELIALLPGTFSQGSTRERNFHLKELPCVIIDEVGDLAESTSEMRSHPRYPHWNPTSQQRVYGIAGERAGREIGQALIRLGHRKVAYLSPYLDETWSKRRFMGLKEVFYAAGKGYEWFVDGENKRDTLTRPAKKGWEVDQAIKPILPALSNLEELKKRFDDPHLIDHMRDTLWALIRQIETNKVLVPAAHRLLAHKEITAWVLANDQVAVQIRHLLKLQGIRIPKHISLVGFDNSQDAWDYHIASYDFEFPEMARASLAHILKPNSSLPSGEFPGMLVERASLAKARA